MNNVRLTIIMALWLVLSVAGTALAQDNPGEGGDNAPGEGQRGENTEGGRRGAVSGGNLVEESPEAENSQATNCEFVWFFETPAVNSCPVAEPTEALGTFQRFEFGYMLWEDQSDLIYVLHHTSGDVLWSAHEDPYVEGDPPRDDSWPEPQPPQTVQPRFGFGELWRSDLGLRNRVGWAVQEWEFVYDTRTQQADDGTLFIEGYNGGVFVLYPNGESWELYR